MAECEIFQVFNYEHTPCDRDVVPKIVMSLRKHGKVQIEACGYEAKAKKWSTAMLLCLQAYQIPGENFVQIAFQKTTHLYYVLTVEWRETLDQFSQRENQ